MPSEQKKRYARYFGVKVAYHAYATADHVLAVAGFSVPAEDFTVITKGDQKAAERIQRKYMERIRAIMGSPLTTPELDDYARMIQLARTQPTHTLRVPWNKGVLPGITLHADGTATFQGQITGMRAFEKEHPKIHEGKGIKKTTKMDTRSPRAWYGPAFERQYSEYCSRFGSITRTDFRLALSLGMSTSHQIDPSLIRAKSDRALEKEEAHHAPKSAAKPKVAPVLPVTPIRIEDLKLADKISSHDREALEDALDWINDEGEYSDLLSEDELSWMSRKAKAWEKELQKLRKAASQKLSAAKAREVSAESRRFASLLELYSEAQAGKVSREEVRTRMQQCGETFNPGPVMPQVPVHQPKANIFPSQQDRISIYYEIKGGYYLIGSIPARGTMPLELRQLAFSVMINAFFGILPRAWPDLDRDGDVYLPADDALWPIHLQPHRIQFEVGSLAGDLTITLDVRLPPEPSKERWAVYHRHTGGIGTDPDFYEVQLATPGVTRLSSRASATRQRRRQEMQGSGKCLGDGPVFFLFLLLLVGHACADVHNIVADEVPSVWTRLRRQWSRATSKIDYDAYEAEIIRHAQHIGQKVADLPDQAKHVLDLYAKRAFDKLVVYADSGRTTVCDQEGRCTDLHTILSAFHVNNLRELEERFGLPVFATGNKKGLVASAKAWISKKAAVSDAACTPVAEGEGTCSAPQVSEQSPPFYQRFLRTGKRSKDEVKQEMQKSGQTKNPGPTALLKDFLGQHRSATKQLYDKLDPPFIALMGFPEPSIELGWSNTSGTFVADGDTQIEERELVWAVNALDDGLFFQKPICMRPDAYIAYGVNYIRTGTYHIDSTAPNDKHVWNTESCKWAYKLGSLGILEAQTLILEHPDVTTRSTVEAWPNVLGKDDLLSKLPTDKALWDTDFVRDKPSAGSSVTSRMEDDEEEEDGDDAAGGDDGDEDGAEGDEEEEDEEDDDLEALLTPPKKKRNPTTLKKPVDESDDSGDDESSDSEIRAAPTALGGAGASALTDRQMSQLSKVFKEYNQAQKDAYLRKVHVTALRSDFIYLSPGHNPAHPDRAYVGQRVPLNCPVVPGHYYRISGVEIGEGPDPRSPVCTQPMPSRIDILRVRVHNDIGLEYVLDVPLLAMTSWLQRRPEGINFQTARKLAYTSLQTSTAMVGLDEQINMDVVAAVIAAQIPDALMTPSAYFRGVSKYAPIGGGRQLVPTPLVPTAYEGAYKALGGLKNYSYVSLVMRPYSKKAAFVVEGPISTRRLMCVPSKERVPSLGGALKRLLPDLPPWAPDRVYKLFQETVKITKELDTTTSTMDDAAVLAAAKDHVREKGMSVAESGEFLDGVASALRGEKLPDGMASVYECFTKTELYATDKLPRMIQCPSAWTRGWSYGAFRELTGHYESLFAGHIVKHLSVEERQALYGSKTGEWKSLDYTSFESSIGPLLTLCEAAIMISLASPARKLQVADYYRQKMANGMYFSHPSFAMLRPACRASGEYTTSVGNALVNFLLMRTAIMWPDDNRDFDYIIEGDDAVFQTKHEVNFDGMGVAVKVVAEGNLLEHCSTVFDTAVGGFACDYMAVLSKLCWLVAPRETRHRDAELQAMKILSALYNYPAMAIVTPVARKMYLKLRPDDNKVIRLLAKETFAYREYTAEDYRLSFNYVMTTDIPDSSYVAMDELNGWTPGTAALVESELCDSVDSMILDLPEATSVSGVVLEHVDWREFLASAMDTVHDIPDLAVVGREWAHFLVSTMLAVNVALQWWRPWQLLAAYATSFYIWGGLSNGLCGFGFIRYDDSYVVCWRATLAMWTHSLALQDRGFWRPFLAWFLPPLLPIALVSVARCIAWVTYVRELEYMYAATSHTLSRVLGYNITAQTFGRNITLG